MRKVLSYVVARDFGFAPNPFHGHCTLGTCISTLRRAARVGDLVIGTGTSTKHLDGRLVYAMQVTEIVTFDEYWNDSRFRVKRPILYGSTKQQYGDNIYHHEGGAWKQEDSHHSLPDGILNAANLRSDTKVDRVLVSNCYTYWGGNGPPVPGEFRSWQGIDIVRKYVGHRHNFPAELVEAFWGWIEPQLGLGIQGRPSSW